MHYPRALRTLLALSVAAAAGCGSGDTSTNSVADYAPVITDSSGITFTAIAPAERAFPDSIVEVLRIAPADSGAGAFEGLSYSTVATNGVDRIYVLSRDDAQVVSFDDSGTALARWGRRGSGPGEFEFGTGLHVTDSGAVELYNFMTSAFVRYAADGSVLPQRRMPRDSGGAPMEVARVMGEEVVYMRRRQEADTVTRELVHATPRDTTVIAALRVGVTENVAFESCPIQLRGIEPYFAPTMTLGTVGDQWAVQRGPDWRIEFFDGPRLTRVWTRDVPVRPASVELLERELVNGFQIRFNGTTCKVPNDEIAKFIGIAAALPALRRIAIAPDGTVWAERFEPLADTQRVDVVAPNGRFLGTVTGRGAPLGFLSGGRAVFHETDEDTDLQELVVVRVAGAGW